MRRESRSQAHMSKARNFLEMNPVSYTRSERGNITLGGPGMLDLGVI